jgi:ABC-2 type transport system permease protein
MLLYHLVTVHALWHAPFYAWLLLVSGWARRATFLWAALPPAAIAVFEKVACNTSHFANLLLYRVTGPEPFPSPTQGAEFTYPWATLEPAKFLSTPGLWIGLTVAAALLAAAARQRRYRAPI